MASSQLLALPEKGLREARDRVFRVLPEESLQEVACRQLLALPLGLEDTLRRGRGEVLAQPEEDSKEIASLKSASAHLTTLFDSITEWYMLEDLLPTLWLGNTV
jgi:hypothetical protein